MDDSAVSYGTDELQDAIAIVGMSGRFPGAADVAAFWRNLVDGVESVTRFRADELEDAFAADVHRAPNFVAARPVLEDVDRFDAAFFGMYSREAELTDPQHRVFLECAWEALEDGGCDPERHPGPIGVFAGCSMNTYFLHHVLRDRRMIEEFTSNFQLGCYPTLVGAGREFLATRVSYKLNLRGPSFTVQSACSTSLLAIAQACQSLQLHQCDAALAGGVSITFPQRRGYLHLEGGMASADGHCRAFDADASGTVFGSGAGVVLLKRLADARADGDRIYALVRGCGVNNDGATKVGFTAPSVDGQADAIAMALAAAQVPARSIGYVECHGTATPLGDPIEIAGLSKAFGAETADRQFCAVGSVKTNIGHLDAAAGVAGLIKTALALHHRRLPPTLHYRRPNPQIDFSASPFYVNDRLADWPDSDAPRRAGVSALGVGGTNVHIVMEQAPETLSVEARPSAALPQLLVLSARDASALTAARERLAERLRGDRETPLADVAWSLQTGRRAFEHRCAFVARDCESAVAALTGAAPQRRVDGGELPRVVFMFPGQGAQYPQMGRGLYETLPAFRDAIDRCAQILEPQLGYDLRGLLYPLGDPAEAAARLRATVAAQPALFAVEYALAQLWMSWGVRPAAMIGHSVGEFVCATLSGVFSLEDALAVVATRARLMQDLPGGSMLAVRLPESDVAPLLGSALSIAAVNGPALCVVSGPGEGIASIELALEARGVACRRLHTSHAFHSPAIDPIVAPLRAAIEGRRLGAPTIPYISCVSGGWIAAEQAQSPDYWARHAREPVRFADGIATLIDGAAPLMLEAGPGNTLATLALQCTRGKRVRALASLPDAAQELADETQVVTALGELWSAGVEPDWIAVHGGARQRVSLPTYPFQRRRCWIDAPPVAAGAGPGESCATRMEPTSMTTMSEPAAAIAADADGDAACSQLTALLEELSGQTLAGGDPAVSFLELGFDSLFLTQVAQRLQKQYGLKITFRQLLTDYPSIAALAPLVADKLPRPGAASAPGAAVQPAAAPAATSRAAAGAPSGGEIEAVFRDQLKAMSSLIDRQLEALRGLPAGTAATVAMPVAEPTLQAGVGGPEPEVVGLPAAASEREAPATEDTPVPLTESQIEVWLAAQLGEDASCAFNQSLTLHLAGPLDTAALGRALDAVVARHDALRARFAATGEYMLIADPNPVACPLLDLSGLPAVDAAARLDALLGEDARTPVDLVDGPALRAKLVRLTPESHVLVLTSHHIVCDGWSFNVIVGDLGVAYRAFHAGTGPQWAQAPRFVEYARREAGRDAESRSSTERYWHTLFTPLPPARLELPTDRARPPLRSFNGARRSRQMPLAVCQTIKQAGARQQCTLFVTMFAGFCALLGRLGDARDIVVGVPHAGQPRVGERGLVGHCVNFLPLRVRWDAKTTVGEFLARVSQAVLEAGEHQDYTLGTLVRQLALPRESGRMPLTEVQFNFERGTAPTEMTGLQVRVEDSPKSRVNFDLFLTALEGDDGIRLDCEYNTDLFDAATIDRWLDSYQALLEDMLADIGQPLAAVSCLPLEARRRLLVDFNATESRYPRDICVHQLFEAQAATTPDALAVSCGNAELTYEALDRRANQIAHHIAERIDGRGELVAVAVQRSMDLPAVLLAVWKAGCAYLPLDLSHPSARLRRILEEARVAAVITDAAACARIAGGAAIIRLDLEGSGIAARPGTAPPSAARADDLAYVIYTSGSTGTPKGVEVTHRSVVNLLGSMAHEPGLAAADRLLAVTTIAFDIAALELFLPLTVGASVTVANADDVHDGFALLQRLRASGATTLQATPSGWRLLLEAGFMSRPGFKMLCGGETLPRELADRLLAGGGELWNMYGPTETTVWSSCARILPGDAPITVGRPIANTQFHVLDAQMQPVPVGVRGELYIGGDGVARGYHRRPELTAERFVANPFGAGRLYRTGDLAQRLANGDTQVLCRLDEQVKLRGFRIELGEIEAALARQPGVSAAAVTLHAVDGGTPALVAYYVPAAGAKVDEAGLGAALGALLPDYMVPGRWQRLAALPTTPNGKLDRKALPAPSAPDGADATRPPAPPSNAIETTLMDIWSEVLPSAHVGIDSDILALGADSIQLFQIVARAHRAGLPLNARQLLKHRTIAELARQFDGTISPAARPRLMPGTRGRTSEPRVPA